MSAAAGRPFVVVLSPAKTLNLSPTPNGVAMSSPKHFPKEAGQIAAALSKLDTGAIKKLMGVSDAIASTVRGYYSSWEDSSNNKPAAFSFDGPAYKALAAHSLSKPDLAYCQDHLRILCGLYGALAPLDALHPYRLEMSTKLAVGGSKDLYAFWDDKIARALAKDLAAMEGGGGGEGYIVNCASAEYWKVLERHVPPGVGVVHCRFPGPAVHAKAARGAMVRYIAQSRALAREGPEGLRGFTGNDGEWAYDAEASSEGEYVFVRDPRPPPKKKAKKK